MKKSEVSELLSFMSGMDNRIVDEARISAWFLIVGDIDAKDAAAIVVEHYKTSRSYLEAVDIVEGAKRLHRLLPKQIEADVRGARARGLVDPEWPEHRPLPAEAQAKLADARANDRLEADRVFETDRLTSRLDGSIGVVLKGVDA